ncbi:MAG: apolipoprotein N-acyltransferase, partial [Flavobacteriaceae bacterium]
MIQHLRLAILSGLLCILAWPVDGLALVIFVALLPLLALEAQIRNQEPGRTGWKVFGYSYLMALVW